MILYIVLDFVTFVQLVISLLLAAREGEGLWGINRDGQLCRRATHFLNKRLVLQSLKAVVKPEDEDWEMI